MSGSPPRRNAPAVRYRITLVALAAEPAERIRLRRALKVLLRAFRFRCAAVEELEP